MSEGNLRRMMSNKDHLFLVFVEFLILSRKLVKYMDADDSIYDNSISHNIMF